jgi:hypothetical protein
VNHSGGWGRCEPSSSKPVSNRRRFLRSELRPQLPVDHWNEVISDTVIFDAIRDRLEHSALTVNITGPTYRGVKARKLASEKKVA